MRRRTDDRASEISILRINSPCSGDALPAVGFGRVLDRRFEDASDAAAWSIIGVTFPDTAQLP
jgi:hypothetical protein